MFLDWRFPGGIGTARRIGWIPLAWAWSIKGFWWFIWLGYGLDTDEKLSVLRTAFSQCWCWLTDWGGRGGRLISGIFFKKHWNKNSWNRWRGWQTGLMTHTTIYRWCRARSTAFIARIGIHCLFMLTIALLKHSHSIKRRCCWALNFFHRYRRRLFDGIKNISLRSLLAFSNRPGHWEENKNVQRVRSKQ